MIIVPKIPRRNNPANTSFDLVCKILKLFEKVIKVPMACFSFDGFIVGTLPEGASERDAVILKITENPGITQAEIKRLYGISTTAVFKRLERENKVIREREGNSFRLYTKDWS